MTDLWRLKFKKKLILVLILSTSELIVKENVENKDIYSFIVEKAFSKKPHSYRSLGMDLDHLKYDLNNLY